MGKGGFALRLQMKRMLLAVLAAAMSLVLSGCFVKTVDELYTLPKHSDEYNRLEQAIDQVMSSQNASYAAPVSGMNGPAGRSGRRRDGRGGRFPENDGRQAAQGLHLFPRR